jgi:hypothetical protein
LSEEPIFFATRTDPDAHEPGRERSSSEPSAMNR